MQRPAKTNNKSTLSIHYLIVKIVSSAKYFLYLLVQTKKMQAKRLHLFIV